MVKEDEVRNVLYYFERSQLVQLLILGHFRAVFQKEKDTIQQEAANFESKK